MFGEVTDIYFQLPNLIAIIYSEEVPIGMSFSISITSHEAIVLVSFNSDSQLQISTLKL